MTSKQRRLIKLQLQKYYTWCFGIYKSFFFYFCVYVVFLGLGGSCSSQHEIFFVTLYFLFYLIKHTTFLNAQEGSVKDSVVGEEWIAQYLLAGLNTWGIPLHWKHLNNRRLEGIQYDSKEKHEYNLKDLQPKRRKLPNDSDMLCIEVIWDRSHLIILCRMTQIILKFFVTSQIWNETNYGHRKYWSRNGIEPNELYDKFGHRIIIWVWHHFHSSKWMANDQIRKLFLG